MRKLALLLVLGIAFLSALSYGQEEKSKSEAYSAVAIGTGGSVGGKSKQFDFRISKYTSDEELAKYAETLKEQGPDALRRALEKVDIGRTNRAGTVGIEIAVARMRQDVAYTLITIVRASIIRLIKLS